MALQPIVLEISSDEEDIGTYKSFESSMDWFSEIFGPRDGESGKADDLVVVDNLSCAARVLKQNSLPSNTARGVPVDDSDDDCEVLDCDPDYKFAAIQDKVDGSDDLLVVGEKLLPCFRLVVCDENWGHDSLMMENKTHLAWQTSSKNSFSDKASAFPNLKDLGSFGQKSMLACRDYPHARHLCANFPFSTTPHENHCNLCHCYVCDSLAPCLYWGTGVSSADHCHSSDKEERWKVQRKSFKTSSGATAQPQKLLGSKSLVITRGRISSLPRPPGPRSAPSLTLLPKSHPLRPCSATSFGIPNIISQRHSGQSVTHINQRSRHQLNRHSVVAPGMHPSTRDRRSPGAAALGHLGVSDLPKFKSSRGAFVSLNARRQQYSDTSHIQMNASTTQKNHHPPFSSQNEIFRTRRKDSLSNIDSDNLQDFINSLECDLGASHNSSSGEAEFYPGVTTTNTTNTTTVSSQSELYSQSLSEISRSQDIGSIRNPVNVSECSSAAGYLQMQSSSQSSNLPVLSESNPISGEDPLGNLLASLEQEDPALGVGKDPATTTTLDPSMFMFDFDELW